MSPVPSSTQERVTGQDATIQPEESQVTLNLLSAFSLKRPKKLLLRRACEAFC